MVSTDDFDEQSIDVLERLVVAFERLDEVRL
jgi:hypothetical protein